MVECRASFQIKKHAVNAGRQDERVVGLAEPRPPRASLQGIVGPAQHPSGVSPPSTAGRKQSDKGFRPKI